MACNATNDNDAVVQIVAAAANGEIKGSPVLQRIAYLLEVAKVGYGFKFGCEFCSPYCEEIERATRSASALGDLDVEIIKTEWGVTKKTYRTSIPYKGNGGDDDYYQIIVNKAISCHPTQLDLATTAAYYHKIEVINNPWDEVEELKAYDRENGTFEKSQKLYEELRSMPALANLPEIPIPTKLAA